MKLRYFFAALGCRSQSRKQQKEFTQLENTSQDGERKTFARRQVEAKRISAAIARALITPFREDQFPTAVRVGL